MKNSIHTIIYICFSLCFFNLQAQWQVSSPNGKLVATIQLNSSDEAIYKVDFVETTTTNVVAFSHLGLNRNDCDFRNGLTFNSITLY